MDEKLLNETTAKRRIKLRKKPEVKVSSEFQEDLDVIDENSTENTKKKILPNRANRGSRMKSLQGKELQGENELYDLIFAERSSDEDFDPLQSEVSSEDVQQEDNANSEIEEESQSSRFKEEEKRDHKKISKSNGAGRKNLKAEEEIIDLDQLDLDMIDELEDKRDRGEVIIDDHEMSESISESDLSNHNRKKKKKKSIIKSKTKSIKEGKESTLLNKKSYRKTFIDDEEEDETKQNRKHKFTKIGIKNKKTIRQNHILNRNVHFKMDNQYMYVNKSVLRDREDENLPYDNIYDQDNDNYIDSEGEEVMRYNEESYKKNLEEENNTTKNIIKNYKKQERHEMGTVRYTFMQEKMSQKELLLEAIFTEYYNIQSLQEMQRLEDLNKKEMTGQGKRQFTEYVRIVKRNVREDKIIENPKDEDNVKEVEAEKLSNKLLEYENLVTFSNPIIYEKIFENFNRKPLVEKKENLCIVTGQPAKYFDPLTKQHYANKEAFKVIRERYFQKEEDALLFRIQTLSDLASQKKEKLKKLILSDGNQNCGLSNNMANQNILNMIYGILKNDGTEMDKKVISHRIYNRNRENCVDSGMLIAANKKTILISKKIFKDKYSNRTNSLWDEDKF